MDTVFVLRLAALALLALGSVLVLRVVAQADSETQEPKLLKRHMRPEPQDPERLRRAA
ncbi:MAG TPA: hypothetical protein VFO85_07830 [Vicinamibacteria bacterium]|nr:hypothetical protein [Vicinamibacteria bacterium]